MLVTYIDRCESKKKCYKYTNDTHWWKFGCDLKVHQYWININYLQDASYNTNS